MIGRKLLVTKIRNPLNCLGHPEGRSQEFCNGWKMQAILRVLGNKTKLWNPSGQLPFSCLSSRFLHRESEIVANNLWAYILIALPPRWRGPLPPDWVGKSWGRTLVSLASVTCCCWRLKWLWVQERMVPGGTPLRLCGHYWPITVTWETEYLGDGNFHLHSLWRGAEREWLG